tara:strand:- start:2896 stop:3081 length:186 start_codon:yes stop_codon:yes gene_type:complete
MGFSWDTDEILMVIVDSSLLVSPALSLPIAGPTGGPLTVRLLGRRRISQTYRIIGPVPAVK